MKGMQDFTDQYHHKAHFLSLPQTMA